MKFKQCDGFLCGRSTEKKYSTNTFSQEIVKWNQYRWDYNGILTEKLYHNAIPYGFRYIEHNL